MALQCPIIVLCDAPFYPPNQPPLHHDLTKISKVTWISSTHLSTSLPHSSSPLAYSLGFSPISSPDTLQVAYDEAITTVFPHLVKTLLPSLLTPQDTFFSLVTIGPFATALGLSLYSLKTRSQSNDHVTLPSGHGLHKLSILHPSTLPPPSKPHLPTDSSLLPSTSLLYMLEYNQTGPHTPPLASVARVTLLSNDDNHTPDQSDLSLLTVLGSSLTILPSAVSTVLEKLNYIAPLLLSPLPPAPMQCTYTLQNLGDSETLALYTFYPPLPPAVFASLCLHPLSLTGSYYTLAAVLQDDGTDAIKTSFNSVKPTFTAEKIKSGIMRRVENPTPDGVGECGVM